MGAGRAEWHAKARSVGLSLSDLVRRSVGRVQTWRTTRAMHKSAGWWTSSRKPPGRGWNRTEKLAEDLKQQVELLRRELQGDRRSIARGVNAIWKQQQQARERQRGPERDYGPSR